MSVFHQGPVALENQDPCYDHFVHVLPLLCPIGNFELFPTTDPKREDFERITNLQIQIGKET